MNKSINTFDTYNNSLKSVMYIQGGPAKVKPLTFLPVTFECIVKFNDFWHM